MADVSIRPTISRRHLTVGPAALVAGAAIGRTHAQSTPISSGDSGPARLASMLSLVPASFAGTTGFSWSDIASQAASVDAAMPTGLPQEVSAEFGAALGVLPVGFVQPGPPLDPATHERFGFSTLTAHQELSIAGGYFGLSLLWGGLPLTDLPAFWDAAGYARDTTPEGIDIWTVPDDPGEKPHGPNAILPPDWLFAILDDTLVMGQSFAESANPIDVAGQIESIITQAIAGGTSLLDIEGYRALIETLASDTVGVVARPGTWLDIANFSILAPGQMPGEADEGSPQRQVEDDPNQVPPVLDVVYALTAGSRGQGIPFSTAPGTPGATPLPSTEPDVGDAIVQARLRFGSPEDVVQAIATIETRWNAWDSVTLEVPYADLLTLESAEPAISDATIAAFDFRPIGTPDTWLYTFLNGDVLPFLYIGTPSATPPA
jgi:hypothetical protein